MCRSIKTELRPLLETATHRDIHRYSIGTDSQYGLQAGRDSDSSNRQDRRHREHEVENSNFNSLSF